MINLRKSIHQSLLMSLMASALIYTGCTTTKKSPTGSKDVVAGSADATLSNEDIPVELKDAQSFDPATTLEQSVVQESDFYQIKKSVEENKQTLEAAWKEQERLEASVRAANAEEEKKKAIAAKQEEEERERQRQIAIAEFEKNKEKQAKEEKAALDEVKKLPTISNEEVMWNGLED